MIVYIDNTKKSTINKTKNQTEKLLELISEFSLVIVYKIQISTKKILHSYILTVSMWKLKLKAFYSPKKIKYLGINLKHIQCMYAKNTDERYKRRPK